MKLREAIEIASRWQEGGDITSFDDVNRAVKLLIEAGKRIQAERYLYPRTMEKLLPGETQ